MPIGRCSHRHSDAENVPSELMQMGRWQLANNNSAATQTSWLSADLTERREAFHFSHLPNPSSFAAEYVNMDFIHWT